jgi:hypothetical protein
MVTAPTTWWRRSLTPTCVRSQVIPLTSLSDTDPGDQICRGGVPQSCFGQGGACNDSMCANSVWDIRAVAQNLAPNGTSAASRGPTAIVNQGIAKRVSTNDIATSCP